MQEHPHADGWCGIVAGYVLRSSAVPTLDGWLLYSDYCKGDLVALAVDGSTERTPPARHGLEVENPIAVVPGPTGSPWILTLGGDGPRAGDRGRSLVDEAKAARGDARLGERKVDHELGAVRGEHVLGHAAPGGPRGPRWSRSQRSTGDPAGTSSSAASRPSTTAAPIVCTAPPSGTSSSS